MSSKISKYILNVHIISVSLFLGLSACGNKNYKTELAQIDSLKNVLDSTEQIKQFDTGYYKTLLDSVKKDMELVGAYYPDSLTIDQALTMDYYKSINKATTNFLEAYTILVKETEALQKQLNDLKGTLKAGEMSLDSFNYYFAREEEDVTKHVAQYKKVVGPIISVNSFKDSIMQEAQVVINKSKELRDKQGN